MYFMSYLVPKPPLLKNSSGTIKPIVGGIREVYTFPMSESECYSVTEV